MQTQAQNTSVPASRKGGPKTETGKNRSRFNAFRHGLTGRTVVMPWEDVEQYRVFCRRMMDDLKPVGAREEQYAQEIIDCSWRLNRAAAGENNLFAHHLHEMEGKVNSGDEEIDAAIVQGMMFRAESGTLLNISLYCNRIVNQRAKSEKRLQELQEKREAVRNEGMRRAAALYQSHAKTKEKKEIEYNPREDGFVFSVQEIEAYLRRSERWEKAEIFGAPPANGLIWAQAA